jgi:hypothetical protein
LRFGDAAASMGGAAGITVDGRITARDGDVVLVAPQIGIGTSALLQAPNGSTILAAGQQVEITGRGLEGITLLVQARDNEARNLGGLEGDAVGIFAGTLRHSGEIQARTASLDGGKVVLQALGGATVDGSARVLATGRRGGKIGVLGQTVAVEGDALIDASGTQGGGGIRIGGDYQGKNAQIRNADTTVLGASAVLRADATGSGDGGRVIVWADDLTQAYGTVSARGGATGGNGGFAEISGKGRLDFQAQVDLRAPQGLSGTLLLDPLNIVIGGTADINGDASLGDDVTVAGIAPGAFGAVTSLITAGQVSFLLTNANLSLAATNNITVSQAITKTSGSAQTLTLDAGNAIAINAAIGGSLGSALGLSLVAGGNITVTAPVTTFGGDLTVTGSGPGSTMTVSSDVLATNMGLTLAGGLSIQAGTSLARLQAAGNQTISSGGNIFLKGGSSGSNNQAVIETTGLASTQSVSANGITLLGGADGGGLGIGNYASIHAAGSQAVTVGNGGITMTGGGGTQTGNYATIEQNGLSGTSQSITINGGGSIAVTGGASALTGVGDGNGSHASIRSEFSSGQSITFTSGGTMTLTGGTVGSDAFAEISTDTAPQTIMGASLITLTGGASGGGASDGSGTHGNLAIISSDFGTQMISAGGMVLQGGAAGNNNLAAVYSGANQSISVGASGLQLLGGGGSLSDSKNAAFIVKGDDVVNAIQTISIGGGGSILIQGGSSFATTPGYDANLSGVSNGSFAGIRSGGMRTGDGVGQVIEFTASGSSLTMTGGTNGDNNLAFIQAVNGSQTIRGSSALEAPTISMNGGASGGFTDSLTIFQGNQAHIIADRGNQAVTAASIQMMAGAGPGSLNNTEIRQGSSTLGLSSTQTITIADGSGALNLQGGSGGNLHFSRIQSWGATQNVAMAAGSDINLTGGTGTDFNFARIEAPNGDQFITGATDITITGGASGGSAGNGNFADIRQRNVAKLQSISASSLTAMAGAGGIENTGGIKADGNQTMTLATAGSNALVIGNAASVYESYITGNNQVIIAGTGGQSGSITVLGGATAGRNSGIFNNAGTQTVATTGTLSLTGGTAVGTTTCTPATSGACGDISNVGTGLQTVSANTIQLQGGSGGVSNGAGIFVNAGDMLLNVGIGGLHLTAGAGTSDNFATIGGSGAYGRTLTVNVAGDTTLNATNGTDGSSALIGMGGTGDLGSVTVNFSGTGNLTLTGSNVSTLSGAAIGDSGNQTNATTSLSISAANVTMSPGTQSGVRFGHSSASNGPGNITVAAGGNIAFNSNGSTPSGIVTTGNVILTAGGNVTEGASSAIFANQVSANVATGVNLDSQVNQIALLSATNTASGDITVANNPANLLTITGMSQFAGGTIIVGANDLDITGPVSAPGGAVTLRPLTLTRTVHVESANSGGVLSLSPSDLAQITTGVLQLGRLDGTGDLSILSSLANSSVNAATLLLVSGNDITLGSGASIGLGGAEFNHNVELHAANNLQLISGNILLADNRNLILFADNDGSLVGNVNIGAAALRVGTGSSNSTAITCHPTAATAAS